MMVVRPVWTEETVWESLVEDEILARFRTCWSTGTCTSHSSCSLVLVYPFPDLV